MVVVILSGGHSGGKNVIRFEINVESVAIAT